MNRPVVHPAFAYGLRMTAAVVTAVAVLFLLSRAAIPEGRLVTVTDFSGPAPFLSEPKPSSRLADPEPDQDGTLARALVKSPLYLDLRPPAAFDTVAVDLRYEASGRPTVEIGALASALDGAYDVRAAEHAGIDALQWPRVASGALTLLQRTPRYASVDEFFRDPPPVGKVATYHVDETIGYRLDGYVPSGVTRTEVVSLRGSHRFLAYAKDEPLSFSFSLQDMNRLEGADPAVVTVRRAGGDGAILARADLDDDGDMSDDQKATGLRSLAVSLADPQEGAYIVSFTTSSDVFIREFATRQSKLVIQGNVYLGDHVGYSDRLTPVTLWSDARRVVFRTSHVEGMQTVTAGGQEVAIDEPQTRYVARLAGTSLATVRSPKRDLLIESDGTFALSSDEWFSPLPFAVGYDTAPSDLDARGIDYLLMRYEPPTSDGEARHAVAVFDTASLDTFADGAYRLAIIAPGADESRAQVRLLSATVTMRRSPLGWLDGLRRLFGLSAPLPAASTRISLDGESFGEAPE